MKRYLQYALDAVKVAYRRLRDDDEDVHPAIAQYSNRVNVTRDSDDEDGGED